MTIKIKIDDTIYVAKNGENLAALMLRKGLVPFRKHPADNSGRAPYCMMGVCFECLVEVNGAPGTQACITSVKDGMTVKRNLSID